MATSIDSRISRLYAEVERRQFEQEQPVDPLSEAIEDYYAWWDGLSEEERERIINNLGSD